MTVEISFDIITKKNTKFHKQSNIKRSFCQTFVRYFDLKGKNMILENVKTLENFKPHTENLPNISENKLDCNGKVLHHKLYNITDFKDKIEVITIDIINNIIDEEEISKIIKKCKKENIAILLNLSSSLEEVGVCDKRFNMTPIKLIEELGLFEVKVIIKNALYLDKLDYKILNLYDVLMLYDDFIDDVKTPCIPPIATLLYHNISVCINSNTPYIACVLIKTMQDYYMGEYDSITYSKCLKMFGENYAKFFNIKRDFVLNNNSKYLSIREFLLNSNKSDREELWH